jgi:hypothetical protein
MGAGGGGRRGGCRAGRGCVFPPAAVGCGSGRGARPTPWGRPASPRVPHCWRRRGAQAQGGSAGALGPERGGPWRARTSKTKSRSPSWAPPPQPQGRLFPTHPGSGCRSSRPPGESSRPPPRPGAGRRGGWRCPSVGGVRAGHPVGSHPGWTCSNCSPFSPNPTSHPTNMAPSPGTTTPPSPASPLPVGGARRAPTARRWARPAQFAGGARGGGHDSLRPAAPCQSHEAPLTPRPLPPPLFPFPWHRPGPAPPAGSAPRRPPGRGTPKAVGARAAARRIRLAGTGRRARGLEGWEGGRGESLVCQSTSAKAPLAQPRAGPSRLQALTAGAAAPRQASGGARVGRSKQRGRRQRRRRGAARRRLQPGRGGGGRGAAGARVAPRAVARAAAGGGGAGGSGAAPPLARRWA